MHGRVPVPGAEDDATAGAMTPLTLRLAVTGPGVWDWGASRFFTCMPVPSHSTFWALWGRGKHVMCVHERGAFRNQDPMNKGKRWGWADLATCSKVGSGQMGMSLGDETGLQHASLYPTNHAFVWKRRGVECLLSFPNSCERRGVECLLSFPNSCVSPLF